MPRNKDVNWNVHPTALNGNEYSNQAASLAVLMDIRDESKLIVSELRTLNNLLSCPNFLTIPRTLRAIQRNTTKKKVKR